MAKIRLIDANALYNDLKESAKAAKEWKKEAQNEEIKIRAEQALVTFIECAFRVKEAPTIEAEPVRHGRWKYDLPNAIFVCSECLMMYRDNPNHCPRCGAKMDGGADNG